MIIKIIDEYLKEHGEYWEVHPHPYENKWIYKTTLGKTMELSHSPDFLISLKMASKELPPYKLYYRWRGIK